jgi:hypothetical protein
MSPQSAEREELPARDRRWVEALRAQAPEGPPPALDAAVLAAARAAVGAPTTTQSATTSRGARPPRWLAAVAGVMVVLSAGVLVRQVAQETAPKQEPDFPASAPVAAPSARSAAGERGDAVLRATREAERLPTRESVETAPAAGANVADAAGALAPAPESAPAPMAAQARAERAMPAQAVEALPPPESPAFRQMAPVPEPMAPPAPPAPARPAADFAPSLARPLGESAPAAFSAPGPEPGAAAKSAPVERSELAETGLAAAASAEEAAEFPEPKTIAEVRRLLAAGEREAARDLLLAWRERHPGAELPAELRELVGDQNPESEP